MLVAMSADPTLPSSRKYICTEIHDVRRCSNLWLFIYDVCIYMYYINRASKIPFPDRNFFILVIEIFACA